MALLLECQFAVNRSDLPALQQLRDWAELALAHAGHSDDVRSMGLRVVSADESRQLNQRYRGVDRPTNVLAFPAVAEGHPPGEPLPLGELVICASVVLDEASEQSKNTDAHWCHMIVHGTLHLAGYDHEQNAGAARMEALERMVLAGCGFDDPYPDDGLPG